jgi:septin family protein
MAAVHSSQNVSLFPKNYVGFDSLPDQINKKLLKRGFQFNVLCCDKSS